MPFPAAAAATAAGQVLSSGINAVAQGSMNRKTRKFAQQQALQARGWALDDWNMQNAYNSPEQQMQRYKNANLNPHLIYGQTNMADAVRSTPAADWNPRAPEVNLDAAPVMSAYWDAKQRPLQTDMLAKQSQLLDLEAAFKAAQTNNVNADTASKLVGTDTSKFNLDLSRSLQAVTTETKQWELNKLKADTGYTLNNDERQAALTAGSLREQVARITNMAVQNAKTNAEKAKIRIESENLLKSGQLQELEIKLRKAGLSPNSPDWLKALEMQLGKVTEAGSWYKKAENFRNDYWKSLKKISKW